MKAIRNTCRWAAISMVGTSAHEHRRGRQIGNVRRSVCGSTMLRLPKSGVHACIGRICSLRGQHDHDRPPEVIENVARGHRGLGCASTYVTQRRSATACHQVTREQFGPRIDHGRGSRERPTAEFKSGHHTRSTVCARAHRLTGILPNETIKGGYLSTVDGQSTRPPRWHASTQRVASTVEPGSNPA